jgi:hypothetical protein
MRPSLILAGGLMALTSQASPAPPSSGALAAIRAFSMAEVDDGSAIRELSKMAYDNAMARVAQATTGCTKDKVKIRKEW